MSNITVQQRQGLEHTNYARFLLFDSLGALIWIVSYVFAGYVFSGQLELAIGYAIQMGSGFVITATAILFTAWITWKYLQRCRFVKGVNPNFSTSSEVM